MTIRSFLRLFLGLAILWPGGQSIGQEETPSDSSFAKLELKNHPVLDLVGGRPDKQAAGHGRNVALYTGHPARVFYATHSLGSVFSAADGATIQWYPDHVLIDPSKNPESAESGAILERRLVCVTRDDVIVAEVHLTNRSDQTVRHRIELFGDCRLSADWRGKPSGEKVIERWKDHLLLRDYGVFPDQLPDGLALAIGADAKPVEILTEPPGTYRMAYEVRVPAGKTRRIVFACAVHPDALLARKHLGQVLDQRSPIAENREDWISFYDEAVPRFRCSDRGLTELYGYRWFLLRFCMAGGDLGYYRYPVVLEGRQVNQTYGCFSAPLIGFDLNWAVDPKLSYGHLANLAEAAYSDGRYPWQTSPRTNLVAQLHDSHTGLSLLPAAVWRHFLIHGNQERLRAVYPRLKNNLLWWIRERDRDGNGLFEMEHPRESGMEDPPSRSGVTSGLRAETVDATSYLYANLRAAAQMARVLSETQDAQLLAGHAAQTRKALQELLWDSQSQSWRDRSAGVSSLSSNLAVTTFYPFFAGAGEKRFLPVFTRHLLNPDRFWLPYPVPALAKDQPGFDPEGFWRGPAWPLATAHVVEALASAAKEFDSSLISPAAELFRRAAKLHLQPRPDFYERYNPLTGRPLSASRDHMNSWWIDLMIQHAAGLMIQEDGSLWIDPLPLGLQFFELTGAPALGKRIDVWWSNPAQKTDPQPPGESLSPQARLSSGLIVRVNGRIVLYRAQFKPGDEPIRIELN